MLTCSRENWSAHFRWVGVFLSSFFYPFLRNTKFAQKIFILAQRSWCTEQSPRWTMKQPNQGLGVQLESPSWELNPQMIQTADSSVLPPGDTPAQPPAGASEESNAKVTPRVKMKYSKHCKRQEKHQFHWEGNIKQHWEPRAVPWSLKLPKNSGANLGRWDLFLFIGGRPVFSPCATIP